MNSATRKIRPGNLILNNYKGLISGFSLMEMLVVIFVFSILGIVTTQILALSLRGSQKSESIGETRANIEYAVSTMERLMRNAKSIDTVNSCNATYPNLLVYTDENEENGRFECSGGLIASGSASPVRLTSPEIRILCSGYNVFTCTAASPDVPQSVTIEVRGQDAELGTGVEGSLVDVKTKVMLRTYEEY